jgi:hypothetical protein
MYFIPNLIDHQIVVYTFHLKKVFNGNLKKRIDGVFNMSHPRP